MTEDGLSITAQECPSHACHPAQLAALEQQCAAQAAELREARREHEKALGVLSQQHAAQVGCCGGVHEGRAGIPYLSTWPLILQDAGRLSCSCHSLTSGPPTRLPTRPPTHHPAAHPAHPSPQVAQLETQLAAAERCAAELRELSAQLGSVRQEDVEVLKVGRWGGGNSTPFLREPAAEAGPLPCCRFGWHWGRGKGRRCRPAQALGLAASAQDVHVSTCPQHTCPLTLVRPRCRMRCRSCRCG